MRVALISFALALGACTPAPAPATPAPATPAAPAIGQFQYTVVGRMCDRGHAVYVSDSFYGTGIAVVPNAPECAQ